MKSRTVAIILFGLFLTLILVGMAVTSGEADVDWNPAILSTAEPTETATQAWYDGLPTPSYPTETLTQTAKK